MKSKNSSRSVSQARKLSLESLESRMLLAGLWQNPVNRLDVDASGQVAPIDALVVINALVRQGGAHPLSDPEPGHSPPPYPDVNGNDYVEPLDALAVINSLNADPMSETYFVQRFLVDVLSGEVKLGETSLAPSDGSEGETTFAGTAIQFNASPLLEQPGNTGRKIINVSLTNRTGETIGQMPGGTSTGLRVLFGDFTNVGFPADLRTKMTVATLAGSGAAASNDGARSSSSFWSPYGVVVDPAGDIYVADSLNYKIRKISGSLVSTLAGSGAFAATDGSGAAASFQFPFGIARNPVDGALIVSDFSGHRIRRVTLAGEVTTVAGTGATGDTNGSGSVATFRNPAGVAVGNDGTIYVVEANGHRIRKIVQTGANPRLASNYTVSVFAGSTASPPVSGSTDDTGASARFSNPRGVTVDSDGTLYVAELGNRKIRRVTTTAQVVTIAGTGAAGNNDGSGNVATFNAPQGIAVIPGKNTLLVSSSGGRQSISQVKLKEGGSPGSPLSWEVSTIAGDGTAGAADGRGEVASFNAPIGVAVDNSGNVMVADSGNNKIRRVTPTNGFFPLGVPSASPSSEPIRLSNPDGVIPTANPVISTTNPVATGQQPFIRYDGTLAPGATTEELGWSFVIPEGVTAFEFTVTVEANTTFLAAPFGVSNPGPTGVGSPFNKVRTVAGNALGGFVDGLATEAKFNYVSGIAVDAAGNRYVADKFNHSIRRISRDGLVTTIAGVAGKGAGGVDGNGSVAQFSFPENLAVTADGQTIYVADTGNHTVRRISLTPSSDPTRPENWTVATIAGATGILGYVDNTTGTAARFNAPGGIAISESGLVYMTEMNGHRVRQLMHVGGDPSFSNNWRVTLVAGGTNVAGTPGADDGFGSSARFNQPHQIAVDRSGALYVADSQNNRIRKISTDNTVTTLAGSTNGYRDDVGTNAQFNQPFGVAVDSAGYVYVADTSGQRIRRISPSGVVTTVAGGAISSLADVDGTGDVAVFYYPLAIAVDPAGSLHLTAGGAYQFVGGGSVTSPGLRVRMIERIITVGES